MLVLTRHDTTATGDEHIIFYDRPPDDGIGAYRDISSHPRGGLGYETPEPHVAVSRKTRRRQLVISDPQDITRPAGYQAQDAPADRERLECI